MSRENARQVSLKALLDYRTPAGRAFILGVAYMVLTVGWLTGRWEWWYGVAYALSFVTVGLLMASPAPGAITMLAAVANPFLSMYMSLQGISPEFGCGIIAMLFIAALLNEKGMIEWRGRKLGGWWVATLAYIAWFLFALSYFLARIQHGWPLNLETILNHGGLLLWSLMETISLMGKTNQQTHTLTLLSWAATIIGAVMLVLVAGWGLALIPP